MLMPEQLVISSIKPSNSARHSGIEIASFSSVDEQCASMWTAPSSMYSCTLQLNTSTFVLLNRTYTCTGAVHNTFRRTSHGNSGCLRKRLLASRCSTPDWQAGSGYHCTCHRVHEGMCYTVWLSCAWCTLNTIVMTTFMLLSNSLLNSEINIKAMRTAF